MNREALIKPALEALLEAPSLAILAVDKRARVILWSPPATRMFGWTESDALGRFLPIVPEDRRKEVYDRIQAELKGGKFDPLDVLAVRKDGSLVEVNLWTAPLRDAKGEITGVLGLHFDTTARRQTEKALENAEAELRRVLSAVSDCIYSGEFDSDGEFFYHYYSPAAERILGQPPLFFLAGPERWLNAIHPDDRSSLAQAFARLQSGQSASEEEEYRIIHPDGTIHWVRDSTVLTEEKNGRRFVNGVISDISARKKMELALQENELELRRVLDAASDYFWSGEIDSEGGFRYRYYSPAVERMTGGPAEFYMVGSERWMSTVHPEDRDRLTEVSKRLRSGQSVSDEYEYRIVLPDGTIRWVLSKTTVSPPLEGHRRVDGVVSDITARKQTEEALRKSELELRRVLGAASDYFWSGDTEPDGQFHYRYFSPAVERITGRPAEFYMAGSEQWMSTVHPEDQAQFTGISEQLLSGESVSSDNEHRIVLPGGRIRWVRACVTVSSSVDGHLRLDGVVSDVTARKQSEEALRESEARFRGIFTAAPSGVVLATREGRFLQANPAFCEFIGYSEQELVAKTVSDITHPEDRPQSEDARRLVWGNEKSQLSRYEKRYLRKDGQLVWGEVSMSLVRDASGNAVHSVGHVVDITERKRSELALRESEERNRLMVEAIPQLAWRTNAQGEVVECNGRWYEYTGQTPEEARAFGWKQALHPDDVGRAIQSVQEDVAGGELIQVEYRLRRASDGAYRWHLARTVPIKDKDGQIVSWFGSAVDIEDQKRLQEKLEERVQERTAELTKATEALRESETKYRTLVEELPATVYIAALDHTYTTLFISPQVKALLGFTPAECVADPDFFRRHVHPDDLDRVMAEANRVRTSGEQLECDYRLLNRGGESVWVRDKAALVRDEAGRPLFLQGVVLDITESRRSQEAMRLQSAALEAAANGIVITDREGCVIWGNTAFSRLTGYNLSEVIGKNLRVLRSGKHDKKFYQNLWQTTLAGRPWHGEIVNKRKNGSLYTEEMTITPVGGAAGEITHFIAIKQDITEWKMAEESQRQLAAIVESSGDAIFAGDFNGTITSWNAGAERLYKYAAEEVLGRSVSVLVPQDRKAELREIIKKLQSGEHIRHYETVRLKKGGIPVDVSITVSPIKNESGQVVGISAITRDISTRKELEKAVVEAGSREQNRIGQDLHDGLCQQLTGIGFLWKSINQREQVRALLDPATVNEVSQLITKTIGEARDLARVLCPVELESNDLGVALKNLGLSMARLSAVSFVVRCQRPVRLADNTVATHLYRIAQEAISNAVRHGKAARIWIHLTWKKDKLTLRIKDNGSGFSKRRGLKEGIGMRSMKYRAQAIGGSIAIESQRGTGTTVVCVYTQPRSRIAGEARRRTPL